MLNKSATYLIISIVLFISHELSGQQCREEGKTITLPPLTLPATCNPQDYVGRDGVALEPGFSYGAQSGRSLSARIDKTLVFDTDYNPFFGPSNFDRSINTSLPVDATAGSYSITPSGAAAYTIPIYTPPGTAGIQPNLSIVYNSQSPSGLLGRGWNLLGLSAITRIPQTLFHDGGGFKGGVNLTNEDRYMLDGNRLILISGNYGNQGAVYQTEYETFSRITALAQDLFKVETKDGLTMTYGVSDDAKLRGTGSNEVISWRIYRAEDNYGNYMTFEYYGQDKGHQIKEIKYTGNGSSAPYNSVHFFYDKKADDNTVYLGGAKVNDIALLREVLIRCEGKAMKKYRFNYSIDISSYLTEIVESDGNGTQLNSTRIQYASPSYTHTEETVSFNNAQRATWTTGDYNGDGKTDLLAMEYNVINPGTTVPEVRFFTEWKLYTNQGNNQFTQTDNGLFPLGFNPIEHVYPVQKSANGSVNPGILDLNGDLMEDLLFPIQEPPTGSHRFTPFFSSGNTFTSGSDFIVSTNAGSTQFRFGDFDGDQRLDVFTFTETITPVYDNSPIMPNLIARQFDYLFKIHFINSAAAPVQIQESYTVPVANSLSPYVFGNAFPADIDGDGKTEIVNVWSNGNTGYDTFYRFSNDGNQLVKEVQSGSLGAVNFIKAGDFNGDGKTDVLRLASNQWQIGYSNGSDHVFSNFPFSLNTLPCQSLPDHTPVYPCGMVYARDMNNDGYSDVVEVSIAPGDIATVNVFYSSGNNFTKKIYSLNTKIDPFFDNNDLDETDNVEVEFGDFNGDGFQDILLLQSCQPCDLTIIYTNKDERPNLVSTILDGFNFKTEFEYKSLSEGGDFYAKSATGGDYPFNNFQQPLYAVSQVAVPDGAGGRVTTNYTYRSAKVHRQGKGFLGFEKLTAENMVTGITTVTAYEFKNFFHKALKSNEAFHGNTPLSKVTHTNGVEDLGNKRFSPRVLKTVSIDYLRDRTVTTDYVRYDTHGNVEKTIVQFGNAETVTTDIVFTDKGSWGVHNRVDYQTVTSQRSGEPVYTEKTDFEYNPQGSLTMRRTFDGLDKGVTTNSFYNNRGNLTLTIATDNAGALTSRNIAYEYDSKGRFITKATNSLGQSETRTHDPCWGKPLSEISIDGLTTNYQYDSFGRLTRMITPDKLKTTHTLNWETAGTLPGPGNGQSVTTALYSSEINPEGAPKQKTWSDLLGREVRTETEGFNQPVYTVNHFNHEGELASSSGPFFSGDNAEIITYTYEDDGRIKNSQSTFTGTATVYTYSAGNGEYTVTVAEPSGQIRSTVTDATGKTTSANDNGGTLAYTYYSNGQPKDIVHNGQAVALMEYDDYARQTKLTDPNAGQTDYIYNAFGELVQQADANNQTYIMAYDPLGRLVSKQGPEGGYGWQYVASGNGLNRLRRITGPNGISKAFAFDDLGRATEITETIDGLSLKTAYEYDQFSNLTKITYPDPAGGAGYAVEQKYNANSYRTKIIESASGNTIWEAQDMNALGQYTAYTNGNGIATQKTYNLLGMTEKIEAGSVQDFELDWNLATGNLNFRKDRSDPSNILTETFSYDNLDRLKSSTVNGQLQTAINYANNGNIDFKTGPGNYAYDANKIHAVTGVDNPTGDIASLTQDITYTPFSKTETVTEGDYDLQLIYGPENQRKKAVLNYQGSPQRTITYAGDYERIETGNDIYEVHYVGGGAINVRHNGVDNLFYAYTDHLGSILALTDAMGDVVYEQNFDAWGRNRNPGTWDYSQNPGTKPDWLTRGFTGHEHLPEFALINMNGRVYDPVLGRFNSPDNYVQAPNFSQSYNRYSYALNNPLIYVDPSGEAISVLAQLAIGIAFIAVGTYLQGVSDNNWEFNPANWNNTGQPTFIVGVSTGGQGTSVYAGVSYGSSPGAVAGYNASTGQAGGGVNYYGVANYQNAPSSGIGSFDPAYINATRRLNRSYYDFGSSYTPPLPTLAYQFDPSDDFREAFIPMLTLNLPEFEVVGYRNTPRPSSGQQLYLDVALGYEGVPYSYGGTSRQGIDCSGLVCVATGNGRVWHTSAGAPPGNWNRIYPSTASTVAFKAGLQRGDLLIWNNNKAKHAAFSLGGNILFHARRRGTVVGSTDDLESGWLLPVGYPNVYRQYFGR